MAAQYQVEHAAILALLDHCAKAKEEVAKAFAISRVRFVLLFGGRALAICGDAGSAQPAADELAKRWPTDTLLNNIWLPLIRAPLELVASPLFPLAPAGLARATTLQGDTAKAGSRIRISLPSGKMQKRTFPFCLKLKRNIAIEVSSLPVATTPGDDAIAVEPT